MPSHHVRTARAVVAIALATAVAATAAPAFAATDMFLELGPVKGESSDRAARGKVELSSFTFSASRKGWDGTIKGNPRTGASDSSAGTGAAGADKYGAVSGAHRDAEVSAEGSADAASGMPTGKRQHGGVTISKPLDRGSVTVTGNLPGCTVGAAYADAVLQTPTERFEFKDAIITSCTMSGSTGGDDRPTESVSLNYDKVIVRGWNPEKKEE